MNGINIKISSPLDNENKSSADADVGQRRKEGGVSDGKKSGRMRSKASSTLKPPPSSGSPTCQSEYDSMNLTYPCQTLAFDRLYKSHLHALIDDEDEESNSSKSSDKVRLPVHILKDDDSISSISSNYDIHEDSDSGIEAEDIEFSDLLDKVFSFNPSSSQSQAAAERSDNNTTSASDFLFCQLGCGHPDMYHDEDTDSFNDLDDFIMGEGGEEETGALKLLNDWVQLNDHPGTVAGTVTVTVDEQGQGEGTIHDEGGDKEWGRKVLGVEGQMHFKTADDILREKDSSLSEDEVPFRVLTITTPSSASGKNSQSQSLRGQKKSTTTDVSATKCCCTIM